MKMFIRFVATLFGMALFFSLASCNQTTSTPFIMSTPSTTYTVTFASEIANGTVTASKTSGIATGETINLTITPASGYILESLSIKNGSADVEFSNNAFIMPNGNVTISATFTLLPVNTFNVTFNSIGGSAVSTQAIPKGRKAERPAAPTKDSTATIKYSFNDWYTSTDNGNTLSENAFDFDTTITENITLYAKWNETPLYNITITNTSNGTVTANKTSGIEENEFITLYIRSDKEYELNNFSVYAGNRDISDKFNTSETAISFQMWSSNLTITATFKLIEAATKNSPNAVGDIVLSDGKAISASEANRMSAAQKASAIAVIFYAGTSSDYLGEKKLGVGIHNNHDGDKQWARFLPPDNRYRSSLNQIGCEISDLSSANPTFTGDIDGSDNWTKICETDTTASEDYYPAFKFCNQYANEYHLPDSMSSGWYLPTIAELSALNREFDTVNASLKASNGDKLSYIVEYWSSNSASLENTGYRLAWAIQLRSALDWAAELHEKQIFSSYSRENYHAVCAIRAF